MYAHRDYASAGSGLIFAVDFLLVEETLFFEEPAIFGVAVFTSAF